MPDVTLTDPLARSIILHDHTWYGHIIKGHPEMAARRASVENAIGTPLNICYSTSDVDCRVYFAIDATTQMYVAVVADVVQGFVKTAYLARAVKGIIEW